MNTSVNSLDKESALLADSVCVGDSIQGGRKDNQDRWYPMPEQQSPTFKQQVLENGWLLIVCDGVGGERGGARASELAIDTAHREYYSDTAHEDMRDRLRHTVAQANLAICDEAESNSELRQMATTMVVAAVLPHGKLYTAHAGDSRAYVMRGGRLTQLTIDHSLVQEQDHSQVLRKGAQATPTMRNVITKSLGLDSHDVEPDVVSYDALQLGDRLLLCSDGLHGTLKRERIEQILRDTANPAQAQKKLLAAAKNAGDNVTAVVFHYGKPKAGPPAWMRIGMFVALGLIVLAIGVGIIGQSAGGGPGSGTQAVKASPTVVETVSAPVLTNVGGISTATVDAGQSAPLASPSPTGANVLGGRPTATLAPNQIAVPPTPPTRVVSGVTNTARPGVPAVTPPPTNPPPTNPPPTNPQPANPQPANPQPANPQPANPQPANPQPSKPPPKCNPQLDPNC